MAAASCFRSSPVALLAEGVDRNWVHRHAYRAQNVALLAEGVDRNKSADYIPQKEWKSPSSRRAWIEMLYLLFTTPPGYVALLAEGVDRNEPAGWFDKDDFQSPSSRRAWIYTIIVLIRDLLSATPAVSR